MATIDNADQVADMIRAGCPREEEDICDVLAVYRYENRDPNFGDNGKTCFCLILHPDDYSAMMISPYVHSCIMLWSKATGTTEIGRKFLSINEALRSAKQNARE